MGWSETEYRVTTTDEDGFTESEEWFDTERQARDYAAVYGDSASNVFIYRAVRTFEDITNEVEGRGKNV